MKDSLKGRVVGYTEPYLLDPSQVEEGEPLNATRTQWGEVIADFEPECRVGTVIVRSIHSDNALTRMIFVPSIHTVMPEGYVHV